MTFGLSLLIAAALAAQAPAPTVEPPGDWRPLGEIEGMAFSWDAAGNQRSGDTVVVRIRVQPPAPSGERTSYAYAITRVELRCTPPQGHAIETINYYPDGRPGETDREVGPFIPIEPNTFFATIHNVGCGSAS